MTTPEIILAIVYVAVFGAALLVFYLIYEKRLEQVAKRLDQTPAELQTRCEKGLAELRAQLISTLHAASDDLNDKIMERVRAAGEGTASLSALGARVDQLTQTFHDYQENTRAWLDKTLESMEKHWAGAASREPSKDLEKIRDFKDKMPRFEERLSDLTEKHREHGATVKRLIEQHKLLSEKMQNAASEEEQKENQRQVSALLLSLSRVLNNTREIFAGGEDALEEFAEKMSPLFKVCDLCGYVHETLSICLNCGKKYCEECKGLQIGHCKECAPYYKPLHIEVNE
jgi:rubrerythrin